MQTKEKNRLFPYQNLDLKNIKNEKWADVPGFEGHYQVSNLGRIKSLPREVLLRWDKPVLIKERILKPRLSAYINQVINKPVYSLIITLHLDGIKYYYSVARLVYYAFIEPFDLSDKHIFIGIKDLDGRNIRLSNLYKTDISELRTKSFAAGRAKALFSELSKPITQFDCNGNPIGFFPSMYEAAKQNNLKLSGIAKAAGGGSHVYMGYFWKWGEYKNAINTGAIRKSSKVHPEIHSTLKKRLGIKKIDKENPPPFLNLSLTNIRGERWKEIPGFEGLYEVSNFGRVKTIQRIATGKRQAWVPLRIKAISIDFRRDKNGKEVAGHALLTLKHAGTKKRYRFPGWYTPYSYRSLTCLILIGGSTIKMEIHLICTTKILY